MQKRFLEVRLGEKMDFSSPPIRSLREVADLFDISSDRAHQIEKGIARHTISYNKGYADGLFFISLIWRLS